MMWMVTVLSIIGVMLNIAKSRACFVVWSFTNLSWCVYDAVIGAYAQAVLFGVYFLLAVIGLIAWKKDKRDYILIGYWPRR